MNELNIKYSNWKHNILTTQDMEAKARWYPDVPQNFLDHVLPILAAIPLKRNESGKILSKETYLALDGTTIKTINGNISGFEVQSLLWVLAKVPRGRLMPKQTQTKFARLASYTPLALYAQKLHNKVKYSEWQQDSSDRYLALFLGLTIFEANRI